jgi:transposase-like protein
VIEANQRILNLVRKEDGMSRKRYKPEQIINLLREAEVGLSQGKKVVEVCRSLGISEQSYYRWRSEYGGMKLVQVKRLKELEKENAQLKKAVAELTLDKLILKEAAEGNY